MSEGLADRDGENALGTTREIAASVAWPADAARAHHVLVASAAAEDGAIVFGVLALVSQGLTLVTLVLLYGAFALVDGVLSLIAAFTGSAKPAPTWWLGVVGLLGTPPGIVTFAWPGITAILLILYLHRRLGAGARRLR